VSASIIVPPLSRMVQTLFGFGLVIIASMTESLLDVADNTNETPGQAERGEQYLDGSARSPTFAALKLLGVIRPLFIPKRT
jgi:hypothetical protein